MCIYVCIYKYLLALSAKWARNNDTQVVKSTPTPTSCSLSIIFT